MGLSGRKVKQRIPADPRNLSWSDDAAKFGSTYLSKFGWDSSKGLGASGDGRTSHIKVDQKLDMLGIGAAHHKDLNGIAWKQNEDFEKLLKRLNASHSGDGDDTHSKLEDDWAAVGKEGRNGEQKRKRDEELNGAAERNAKKIRRKCAEDANSKTSKQATAEITGKNKADCTPPEPAATPAHIPRHRAHRARAIASKNMASKTTTAISEILGIAPTPSSSVLSGSGTPCAELTSLDDGLTLEKLTTSTKSVADYFRDKLLARSSGKSGTSTPRTECETEARDAPRGGLGSSRSNPNMPKLPSPIPCSEPINQEQATSLATSEDISFTNKTRDAKQKRRKEKDPAAPLDNQYAGGTIEEKKRAKSDKKPRKARRSRVNKEGSC